MIAKLAALWLILLAANPINAEDASASWRDGWGSTNAGTKDALQSQTFYSLNKGLFDTLISIGLAAGSGLLVFVLLSWGIKKVIPDTDLNQIYHEHGQTAAGLIAGGFGVWLAVSIDIETIQSFVFSALKAILYSALTAIFMTIGGLLFWKKLRAWLF